MTAAQYGKDLSGVPVGTREQYLAAVASVRTPAGCVPPPMLAILRTPVNTRRDEHAENNCVPPSCIWVELFHIAPLAAVIVYERDLMFSADDFDRTAYLMK